VDDIEPPNLFFGVRFCPTEALERTLRGFDMTMKTHLSRLTTAGMLAMIAAFLGIQGLSAQGQDTRPADRERLLASRSCDGCDLSGVDLSRQDLKSVSAANANLSGASFYHADLTNANLGGANLSKANLTMANLSNTNLANANLDGANLNGSTGASLAGATTTKNTTCPDGQVGPCR